MRALLLVLVGCAAAGARPRLPHNIRELLDIKHGRIANLKQRKAPVPADMWHSMHSAYAAEAATAAAAAHAGDAETSGGSNDDGESSAASRSVRILAEHAKRTVYEADILPAGQAQAPLVEPPHGPDVDVRHCDGAGDAQALERHKRLYESNRELPHPKVHLLWPALDTLQFSVTLPYVPGFMRYVLSFEPVSRDPEEAARFFGHPTRCSSIFGATSARVASPTDGSSDFDTSDDALVGDLGAWDYAPNANVPHAFSDADAYPANFVSNFTAWRAAPTDCAHVRYTARFTLDELEACGRAVVSVPLDGGVHVTLGTLHILGMTRVHSHSYEHAYDLSLYTDAEGNAALLFDNAPAADVLVRSIGSSDDGLSLQLQTAVYAPQPLELLSVTPRQAFDAASGDLAAPPLLHARESKSAPYKAPDALLQNWDFDTESAAAGYDGQYALLFGPENAVPSSSMADSVRSLTELMVRIDDSPAATRSQLARVHGSIAQHRPDTAEAHDGAFRHGDRICMQSYLMLPSDLVQHAEIELLEALLCPADDTAAAQTAPSSDEREFVCRNHTHGSVLYEAGKARRDDVELVWPGAYGPSSVALCFDASATLLDDQRRSVVRTDQRYEARVALHAHNAAAREASAAWHSATAQRHEAALHAERSVPHLQRRAALARSQFRHSDGARQTASFARGNLERSFAEARAAHVLDAHERQSYEFVVERSEHLAHSVDGADAILVISLIVSLVVCVVLGYAALVWRRARASDRSAAAPLSNRLDAFWRRKPADGGHTYAHQ